MKKILLGLVSIVVFGGCVGADWQMIDAGDFTFSAPPEWKFETKQGIDSYVATLTGDGAVFNFDYGMFSGNETEGKDVEFNLSNETINGFAAVTFTPKETGKGFTGVYFENPKGEGNFSMLASDLTKQQEEVALMVFRTIFFKQ